MLVVRPQIIVSSTGNSAQVLTTLGLPPPYESAPGSLDTDTSSPMPVVFGHGGKANGRAIQFPNSYWKCSVSTLGCH
jgi:hypothetical protein